jgi:23S rRNA maturation-related 3'-5' exoribonuclease YhaM
MKSEILNPEIALITNPEIRKFVTQTLENSPDYFYEAQASSTGKYHPACTIKKGGLVVHVKRAVYLANHLCDGWGLKGLEKDIVLAAMILHDIAKTPSNDPRYTYADFENHPINAEKYLDKEGELNKEPNKTTINLINEAIKHHMGLWTPASIKKPIINYSLVELAVYTSDYLASRKDLVTPKDGE